MNEKTEERDVENPSPVRPSLAGASAAAATPTAVPNDHNPHASQHNVPKWKIVTACTFLVAVVVLAIALGVTLGRSGDDGTSTSASATDGVDGISEVDVVTTTLATEAVVATAPGDGMSTTTVPSEVNALTTPSETIEETDKVDDADSATTTSTPPATTTEGTTTETTTTEATTTTTTTSTTTATSTVVTAPVIEESLSAETQFLAHNGPIPARIRMIDPTIANGYESCSDLKDDIRNAIHFLANSVISREMFNDYYEKCDPNNPYWWQTNNNGYWYKDEMMYDDAATSSPAIAVEADAAEEAPPMAAAPETEEASASREPEDSFETNNQVEGVDEADIVKSDGKWVFAGYGDILYVWNATNGSEGISITRLPYNDTEVECEDHFYYPEPMPIEVIEEEGVDDVEVEESPEVVPTKPPLEATAAPRPVEDVEMTSISSSNIGGKRARNLRNRKHQKGGRFKRSLSMPIRPHHCGQPKPRILALLFQGTRVTAIVSEESYFYGPYDDTYVEPIVSDYSKLSIRVYDASAIPTNGDPLPLLGVREIKGNYNSARSFGSTGIVISTSYLNTYQFVGDLYRYQDRYCGLNATQYEALATEIALNTTDDFVERMVDELQVDGSCNNIFQISALQSGSNSSDNTNENLLQNFVQVLSFDMNESFVDENITTHVAGAFASGYLSSVYVSRDFAATLNVGSSYNPTTGEWEQSTFILGFDIGGTLPEPMCVGEVPGSPINQYAADLYEGHLRVATTEWNWSRDDFTSRTTNRIFVFKIPVGDEGQQLQLTGVTPHLGKENESIFAVRFIGDKAYVVTFERIDPFLIVDVSNHSDPHVVGELEIPGFSSYLHPITIDGTEILLGLGQHVDTTSGWRAGVKISLFNITEPTEPTEMANYIDYNAYSNAQHDFKSFRYLPFSQKLILPKSEWTYSEDGNFDGFVVYDINTTHITPSHEISHASSLDMYRGCWYSAYMPPRSLVFKSKVTTILSHTVISTDLDTGDEEWRLNLDEGLNNTECAPYFVVY